MTEAELQKACTSILDAHGIWWSHVPNRVFRGRKVGKNVKSQPDLIFVTYTVIPGRVDCCHPRPVTCELKLPGGKWKPGQRERLAKMAANGWECYRVESVREFERVLTGRAEVWRAE